jgi:hypothetical protein
MTGVKFTLRFGTSGKGITMTLSEKILKLVKD